MLLILFIKCSTFFWKSQRVFFFKIRTRACGFLQEKPRKNQENTRLWITPKNFLKKVKKVEKTKAKQLDLNFFS